jgi:aspartate carbamoyltransferase regulatory subunit
MAVKAGIIVEPIKNGTVIDHIQAGKAITILKFLNVPPGATMGIAINVPSKKYGRKDIIFVEGLELTAPEIAKVALISQSTTLNIIRDARVVEKRQLSVPRKIEGIIRCPNVNCVSNHEAIDPKFVISDDSAVCNYCEIVLTLKEVEGCIV